uniref:PARP catalytic domain-containing protein n=1 Tax=Lepisosteus oculatus TaxID=7918 RepID=W5NNS8_LEPOC
LSPRNPAGPSAVGAEGPSRTLQDLHHVPRHSAERRESILIRGFQQSSSGMLGRGVYVSRDYRKAERYPLDLPPPMRVLFKMRVKLGRVKAITKQNDPLRTTWHKAGYDAAWVPPKSYNLNPSGLEETCVWDPRAIRVLDVVRAPAMY